MERDNLTSALEEVGATVLANACGPCIGQVMIFPSSEGIILTACTVEACRPDGFRKWYASSHSFYFILTVPRSHPNVLQPKLQVTE